MTKSLRSRLDPMVGRLQLFTAQQHFNHGYESALLLLQTSVPSAYVELRPGLCQLFIILIYYTLTFFFFGEADTQGQQEPIHWFRLQETHRSKARTLEHTPDLCFMWMEGH